MLHIIEVCQYKLYFYKWTVIKMIEKMKFRKM
jgi:hypothetical protein